MVGKCKICGDAVPLGKELCWCCEHGPLLHTDNSKKMFDVRNVLKDKANNQKVEVAR